MAAFDLQIFPNNQLGSDTDMLSQIRSGGVEFFTLSPPDPGDAGSGRVDQRHRLRLPGLRHGLEGDGRRPRRLYPRPDRQGQSGRDGQDLGQRLPPDHLVQQGRSITPDDLKGFKIRVPVSPLWTSMFKAFDAGPRLASTSARSTPRCRPRSSTARRTRWPSSRPPSSTRCRNICSMTNHMWDGFWFLGQPPRLGAPAGGSARHRRQEHQRRRRQRSAPTSRS